MSELPPLAEHDNPQRRAAQRARWAARPRPEVTLDQLHTFLAVAERQHVSEAAEALGISQGSVSTVVHRLEKRLGLPLFQRVGRNVRLTDVGRARKPCRHPHDGDPAGSYPSGRSSVDLARLEGHSDLLDRASRMRRSASA